MVANQGASFILTMRNLNYYRNIYLEGNMYNCFILTMRNLNVTIDISFISKIRGFILTMRNLNGIS